MQAGDARRPVGLPRADLGVRESPVERWVVEGTTLWIKRDDQNAATLGGNKVRALELLLGAVPAGRSLLTVGATGSTHALAVAQHGAALGLRTEVITWPQEEHDVARATARRLETLARVTPAGSVVAAYLRAATRRARGGRHWIPAGGSVPLGAVGQVSAALELARQVARGDLPTPAALVVPLGSGGTAAGLLLGLALAGLPTRVVGVQVVPRIVASHRRVLRLAAGARALLQRGTPDPLPSPDPSRLTIVRDAYGGAYGRPTRGGSDAAAALALAGGPALDPTYSAKAFGVALREARASGDEAVLFWLTFDARWLGTC